MMLQKVKRRRMGGSWIARLCPEGHQHLGRQHKKGIMLSYKMMRHRKNVAMNARLR
jgi:hypothetical protein